MELLRYSGKLPLRSELGPEYALAVLWAEAAFKIAKVERMEITTFLKITRAEHNKHWRRPVYGKFPNEVFKRCFDPKQNGQMGQ